MELEDPQKPLENQTQHVKGNLSGDWEIGGRAVVFQEVKHKSKGLSLELT